MNHEDAILRYEVRDDLGFVRLSNPPDNRFLSPVFADAAELSAFLSAPQLRAVVVRGEGRHFSAGADPERLHAAVRGDREALAAQLQAGKGLLELIARAPVPVMAVIHGSCFGAGLELALACHFRYAARHALLGFPEATHGLLPGLGGTIRSASLFGTGHAAEMIVSGKLVSGEEAERLGLVDRTAPRDEIDDLALSFVRTLTADRPAYLIHAIMESIHNATRLPVDEALRAETRLFRQVAARLNGDTG
jgi:enoyl-CoA hydratase